MRYLLLLTGLLALGTAQQLKVVTTTTFLADMAQNIAGNKLRVHSLLPVGTDPHIYEPVPETSRQIFDADLILVNGLTLEGWMQKLIDNSGTKATVIRVTKGIKPIQSEGHANASDPHAWTCPNNAKLYCRNIRDALIAVDPQNAEAYRANYRGYANKLTELDSWIHQEISRIPQKRRVLITSHDAFRYYAQRYGLQVEPLMGTTTDADVQAGDMKRLSQLIAERDVTAVFAESTINPKLLEQLAKEQQIIVGGSLYGDSLSDEDGPAATYIEMLRHNTRTIVHGLTQGTGTGKEDESLTWLLAVAGIMLLAALLLGQYIQHKRAPELPASYHMEVSGVSVTYGGKTAISSVYLKLEPGCIYGLVGANGSGKSTLLKAVLGLVPIDTGKIELAGSNVDAHRQHIAYIPQKEDIDWRFPATVEDVVRIGRYPHKSTMQRLSNEDKKLTKEAMEQVEIGPLAKRQISQLSGGQQQRTFIARALCQQADIYLMDEPFVGVDAATEERIMKLIRELADAGKMVLIIHHDLTKAAQYFDEVILFNQRVVAQGPPAQVMTDDNLLRTFGGRLNLLQS